MWRWVSTGVLPPGCWSPFVQCCIIQQEIRKPGNAFTSLTVLVGEWEEQLPSRIRPGKIGPSQISVLNIPGGDR